MGFDDILDFIGGLWETFTEGIIYVFSFEWFGDLGEFFSAMFEGIFELSFLGLGFGLLGAGMIYFLRDYMLTPFTKFMSPFQQIFWTVVTYIGCFIAGYLVGKGFENTG